MDRLGFTRIGVCLTMLFLSLIAAACGPSAEFKALEKDYQSLRGPVGPIRGAVVEFCPAIKYVVEWQKLERRAGEIESKGDAEVLLFAHIDEDRRVAETNFAIAFEQRVKSDLEGFRCEGLALTESEIIWKGTHYAKEHISYRLKSNDVQRFRELFLASRKKELFELSMDFGDTSLSKEAKERILGDLKKLVDDTREKGFSSDNFQAEASLVEVLNK